MSYANVYDPNDYEEIIEKYEGEEYTGEALSNIWGNFVPTFYQFEWFEFFNQKLPGGGFIPNLEATGVIHRRAGKSVGVVSTIFVPRTLNDPGLYLHIFPSLTQARGAIWNGMGRITRDLSSPGIPYMDLFPRRYRGKRNNHDMTQEIYGKGGVSLYRLGGARGSDGTANHWRGFNPLGVIPDEYGEWQGDVVTKIFEPVLGQNGGFMFKIGTPNGENQFFTDYLYDTANVSSSRRSWLLTVDDTYYNDGERIISKEFITKLLAKGADPEIIQQEYYCSFKASATGAWYRYEMVRVDSEDRIRKMSYNSAYPVYTAWDNGGDGQRCIIFQAYEDYVRIIDFIAMKNVPTGVPMDIVNARYTIEQHFFPHDVKQRNDVVTKLQSRIQALREEKNIHNIVPVPRALSLVESIAGGSRVMSRCIFNEELCQELVTDLRNYKRKLNKSTATFSDDHVHDKASHSADAYRTMATAYELGMFKIHNRVNLFQAKMSSIVSKVSKFSFGGNI